MLKKIRQIEPPNLTAGERNALLIGMGALLILNGSLSAMHSALDLPFWPVFSGQVSILALMVALLVAVIRRANQRGGL